MPRRKIGDATMPEPLTSTRSARKPRQRERLIAALLQHPSLERAAESMGISRVTAWRIQQTPEFQQEYRQACRAVESQARARLQQATNAATSAVLKIMVDPKTSPTTRLQAVDRVFKYGRAPQSEDAEVRQSADGRRRLVPWQEFVKIGRER